MVKSIWIVEENEYDFFSGNECRQTGFSSLQEAWGRYKERKASDFDFDDHCRRTTIFHTFVYENEEKIRQNKRREEKRREKVHKVWEKEYQSRMDEIRRILNPEPVEGEYVFDDDSIQF